jgi:hypothetical protein
MYKIDFKNDHGNGFHMYTSYIGCSFKFLLKVDAEDSIVNAPLVSLQSKNTNNTKGEVRFKQLIRDLYSMVRSQLTLQRQL